MARLTPALNHSDHVLGAPLSTHPAVTLVEYGDFQCPYSAQADDVVTQLLDKFGPDVSFVYRNFPLMDLHPDAMLAAQAAEAAGAQGKYWEMHRLLFERQDTLEFDDLIEFVDELGLDVEQFVQDIEEEDFEEKVLEDIRGAKKCGVDSTPSFFLNGLRYDGEWDVETLSQEIEKIRDGFRSLGPKENADLSSKTA